MKDLTKKPRYIKIVKAYKSGMPINDIITKFGYTRSTVYRYVHMEGLSLRQTASPVRDKILARYRRGDPVAKISAALGVSRGLVSRYANDAGIGRNQYGKRN